MSAILAFLGPKIIGLMVAGLCLLFGAWKIDRNATNRERNKQKAKEADAYESHLKDIADAANARPSGSLSDDPNNRDR